MKYKWLNESNNKKLIVFFNGWGMDESVVEHFLFEDFDVLMFYDYNSLDTDFDFELLKKYPDKYLIAWSMGVMVGTLFEIEYISATAINGTLKPIDENFGIHPKIYDLTIKGFNEKGRERFLKTIFNENFQPEVSRELEEQKSELSAIKTYSAKEDFKYTKIFISDSDKIIPTKSQTAYWETEANLKGAHCPFDLFTKWSELL